MRAVRASLEADGGCDLDPVDGVPRCYGGAVLPEDDKKLLQEWQLTRSDGFLDLALRQWVAAGAGTWIAKSTGTNTSSSLRTLSCQTKL